MRHRLLGLLALAAFLTAAVPGSLLAATTTRVSVAGDGTEGNSSSGSPAISADGRYVAFESSASNLVPGEISSSLGIFVHDRQTGQTERVSVASDGAPANSDSFAPAISADGRYVAFDSWATNLVLGDLLPGDANDSLDVFVHDRQTGQTERVSVASDGAEAHGLSQDAAISADGRYVAFASLADDLVSDDSNGTWDTFVHDRETGQTQRVSVASDSTQGNDSSFSKSISADGRYVAFSSSASNLVLGDANDCQDIFVHDRQTGQTERASVASDGAEADGDNEHPTISADGRYVAFYSYAPNLVAGDTNGLLDVFVHDRQTGQTERVSVASDGAEGNDESRDPSFSADGRYLAFASSASNLVGGDTNGYPDVFVHDCQTGQTKRVSVASEGTQGNGDSGSPAISADGGYVAFGSFASNLVPGDGNATWDVFLMCDRPEASFSADPRGGLAPLTVVFTDLSTGNPTAWTWEFGDGDTSTQQHPSHQYLDVGSYTVSLTVTDGLRWDAETKVDYITVVEPAFAAFTATPTAGATPLQVSFTDQSTGGPNSWNWAFGDGAASTEQDPIHVYTRPSYYPVTLTASNGPSADTETKEHYISVGFPDAPLVPEPRHWAAYEIIACATDNIVQGYPDGSYWPDLSVTRDQMAVYIARALLRPTGDAALPTPEPPPTFSDVPTDFWAYQQIEYAASQNVVEGYPGGRYRPSWTVDRGQMAVYIARAMTAPAGDSAIPEPVPPYPFPDVPGRSGEWAWCSKHVAFLATRGIVTGYEDGYYHPEYAVARDQMAVYIQRAFDLWIPE